MAQQLINHGTVAGDGTGESPFTGMQKTNANFTELYTRMSTAEGNISAKAPINDPTFTGTVNGVTKAMVGLSNVDNVADGSKPVSTAQAAAIAAGDNLRLKASDIYSDFVASGLATPVPTNSLTGVMSVGIAHVNGIRTERVATSSHAYQFSSDTYVDIDSTGTITRTPVANGAAAPSLAAGSLRLEKVVTDATKITSVLRMANSAPLLKQATQSFTVGVGGNFTNLQSAFDYIATLPAWEAVGASSTRDVLSWASGSSDLVIDSTNTDLYGISLPQKAWMLVTGESYYYPIDVLDATTDTIVSSVRRIDATIASGLTVTFWTPIIYTLELLDNKHHEYIRIPSNVHVKLVGRTEASIGAPATVNATYHGAWNRADAFKSGTLIFGAGIRISHGDKHNQPFMTNNGYLTYNWGVPTTIGFEFLPGCKFANVGAADLFSAGVRMGYFKALGVEMLIKTGSGTSHYFHLQLGGDFVLRNCVATVMPIRRLFNAGPDLRLVEKSIVRAVVIDNLSVIVDDPKNDLSLLVVVGNTGIGATPSGLVLSNVTVTGKDTTTTNVILVDEGIYNDDNASVAATGKVMMANCHIRMPNNTGVKKLYRALAGSTVALNTYDCTGGDIDKPSAGTRKITGDVEVARMYCDAIPTSIPSSASGPGTYNTKLLLNSTAEDTVGTVADLVNSQFVIPAGFRFCRIAYAVAFGIPPTWAANTVYALNAQRIPVTPNGYFYRATTAGTSHASVEPTWPTTVGSTVVDGTVTWTCHSASEGVGWRGCRIKDENGKNYGNQRIAAVSSDATTNACFTTPWVEIVPTYDTQNAPAKVHVGAQIALYPAQTSGDALGAGEDFASSWYYIELKR